jgi:hypothetical protein
MTFARETEKVEPDCAPLGCSHRGLERPGVSQAALVPLNVRNRWRGDMKEVFERMLTTIRFRYVQGAPAAAPRIRYRRAFQA